MDGHSIIDLGVPWQEFLTRTPGGAQVSTTTSIDSGYPGTALGKAQTTCNTPYSGYGRVPEQSYFRMTNTLQAVMVVPTGKLCLWQPQGNSESESEYRDFSLTDHRLDAEFAENLVAHQ
eukprot:184885-Rhodomonas_salina.1